MDHYKILGVSKNATKDEIKKAYLNLAKQLHPDKHAHSPPNLKQSATSKFKLVSQAYETLINDRTRADYNRNQSTNQNHYNSGYSNRSSGGYDYGRRRGRGGGGGGGFDGYGYSGRTAKGEGVGLRMEMFFRFLNTKAFLLNAAFVGFVLASSVVIDSGGQTLWEMQNSGKTFEDAMESIEKSKKFKLHKGNVHR